MKVLFRALVFASAVGILSLVLIPLLLLYFDLELAGFDLGVFRFLGLLPILFGLAFMTSVVQNFALVGEGTPAPFQPPKKLVRVGLHARVRNPMYTGAIVTVLGEAVLLGSSSLLAYALVLFIFFHLFVLYNEEPGLMRRFGVDYEEYCRRVPRWIPRPSSHEASQ